MLDDFKYIVIARDEQSMDGKRSGIIFLTEFRLDRFSFIFFIL